MEAAELLPTEDGSLTLMDDETGELYHNSAGAYTEALENYYVPSTAAATLSSRGKLTVLDACFGLGYNSLVMLAELMRVGDLAGSIEIIAIETDPRVISLIGHVLQDPRFSSLQAALAQSQARLDGFSQQCFRSGQLSVSVHILQDDLRRALSGLTGDFDLVFHDPFSPRKVPELWTVNVFAAYRQLLDRRRGRLLTYSTAAAVKAALHETNFYLYRTTAVGRKKGGTLASVALLDSRPDGVYEPTAAEVSRLKSGQMVPYRDSPSGDPRETIVARRLAEQGLAP